jgi:RNA polymerase sigma-70 factor (ECF subfamily)
MDAARQHVPTPAEGAIARPHAASHAATLPSAPTDAAPRDNPTHTTPSSPNSSSPDSTPSDESLLKSFTRGDLLALDLLARRHEGALLALARGVLGCDDLARDAVQESWLRVIRHAKGFVGTSSVRTWLYRIVINRCLDLARNRLRAAASERANPTTSHSTNSHSTNPHSANPPSTTLDAFESASARERIERLRAHLRQLPEGDRVIILLCYQDRVGHAAAAEILGIPIGTLKSRLHAALLRLRALAAQPDSNPVERGAP